MTTTRILLFILLGIRIVHSAVLLLHSTAYSYHSPGVGARSNISNLSSLKKPAVN
jgi:hypothetical protein